MRDRGYETKVVVHLARNLTEFPREFKPVGMKFEDFYKKMQEKYPGKVLGINGDQSVQAVSERHFPPQEERPRKMKSYKDFSPLWDSYDDLER